MRCDEIRTLLGAYVDAELRQSDIPRVEEHLKTCQDCVKIVAELNKVKQLVKTLPRANAPKELLERVNQPVRTVHPGGKVACKPKAQSYGVFWRYRWAITSLASAAVILVLILATTTRYSYKSPASDAIMQEQVEKKELPDFDKASVPALPQAKPESPAEGYAVKATENEFTQQVQITTDNVTGAFDKVNELVASLPASEKDRSKSYDEDFQRNRPAEEARPDSGLAPASEFKKQTVQEHNKLADKKSEPIEQVIRVQVPLDQKDIFIHNLKDYVDGNITVSEMMETGMSSAAGGGMLAGKDTNMNWAEPGTEETKADSEALDTLSKGETGAKARGAIGGAPPPTALAPAPTTPAKAAASKQPDQPGSPAMPDDLREKTLAKNNEQLDKEKELAGTRKLKSAFTYEASVKPASESGWVEITIIITNK